MLAAPLGQRLLLGRQHRQAGELGAHTSVFDGVARAPFQDRLRVQIVPLGEFRDRSFRSPYRRSDGVRGLGAPV